LVRLDREELWVILEVLERLDQPGQRALKAHQDTLVNLDLPDWLEIRDHLAEQDFPVQPDLSELLALWEAEVCLDLPVLLAYQVSLVERVFQVTQDHQGSVVHLEATDSLVSLELLAPSVS